MQEVEARNINKDINTSESECIKWIFCKEQPHDKNTQSFKPSLALESHETFLARIRNALERGKKNFHTSRWLPFLSNYLSTLTKWPSNT